MPSGACSLVPQEISCSRANKVCSLTVLADTLRAREADIVLLLIPWCLFRLACYARNSSAMPCIGFDSDMRGRSGRDW